jgi:hypothetical protein
VSALSEAPDLYQVPEEPEARAAWRVRSNGEATWALRKLAGHMADLAADEAIAKAEIERIEAWLSRRRRIHDGHIDFFNDHLADYALRVRKASGGDVKEVSTPYGTVSTRMTTPKWEQDEVAAIEWARTHRPDLVQTTERFDLRAAKKRGSGLSAVGETAVDEETGEVLPFLTVVPGRLSATVTVASVPAPRVGEE